MLYKGFSDNHDEQTSCPTSLIKQFLIHMESFAPNSPLLSSIEKHATAAFQPASTSASSVNHLNGQLTF